jgi:hypothetical protein
VNLSKREAVKRFYKDLLDIDMTLLLPDNPINEDIQSKFNCHSMCLTLEDINSIYGFFKDHFEEFTTSK